MKNRSKSATREYNFLFIYQILNSESHYTHSPEDIKNRIVDFNNSYAEQDEEKRTSSLADVDLDFSFFIIEKCLTSIESSAKKIDTYLKKKTFIQLNKIEQTLLLVSITEHLQVPDTPRAVIITEYMKLAETYATKQSAKFLNGILDAIISK